MKKVLSLLILIFIFQKSFTQTRFNDTLYKYRTIEGSQYKVMYACDTSMKFELNVPGHGKEPGYEAKITVFVKQGNIYTIVGKDISGIWVKDNCTADDPDIWIKNYLNKLNKKCC